MTDLRRTPLRRLLLLSALMGGASLVEDTATGNPVTFETDVAKPLVSLEIPFTPKQSGTGDPSPQNIRPLVPWNGLTVFGGGKNLVNCTIGETKSNNGIDYVVLSDGGVNCEGTANGSSYGIESKKITLPSGMYTFSVTGATNAKTVIVKNNAYYREINGDGSTTFTLTEETVIRFYIMFSNGAVANETVYVQLEVGQTATAYEPYTPITETDISFPSPVYGGTLDVVSGVLTVEYGSVDLGTFDYIIAQTADEHQYFTVYYAIPNAKKVGNGVVSSYKCEIYKTVRGSEIYTGASGNNAISMVDSTPPGIRIRDDRFNTESEIKTALNGIMLYYELATPQEITLTPEQITALIGDNTIWSDADGSMTAVYLKKG